jgi:hypothetical protein
MVPTLVIAGAIAAMVAAAKLVRANAREMFKFREHCRKFWWSFHKRERDGLLSAAREAVFHGRFRVRHPHEDLWTYALAFDAWKTAELAVPPTAAWFIVPTPRPLHTLQPRISQKYVRSNETYSFTATIKTEWWSATLDDVVHRIGAVAYNNQQTFVLRCDPDEPVETRLVRTHLDGQGPLVTCVRCFQLPRY